MVPQTRRVDLTLMPYEQKRRICPCKKKCDIGISITTYNDGLILCWNESRKFFYGLVDVLEEDKKRGWSDRDRQFLIDYHKKHGAHYGWNKKVAEALGYTVNQVKVQVREMRARGQI